MASAKSQHIAWSRCRGRNGWDAPQDIRPDMANEALNVHFYNGGLATKRGGSTSTGTLTGATGPLNALYSWVPGQDASARELFVVDNDSPVNLLRIAAGSTTADITLKDAIDGTASETSFASLNGKLFIAYNSDENRIQVFDPDFSTSATRRGGLAQPDAPTEADTGSGSISIDRYYKVAYTYQDSGVTLRRSELSASVLSEPSGSGSAMRVTKPSSISESETHWELYVSLDDTTYYGPIATTAVGTTTYDDSTADASMTTAALSAAYDLAPVSGTNKPFPSVKFLYSNGVRLFGLGVYETTAGDSHTPQDGTVYFTPALDASAIDDEERCQDTTSAVGRLLLSRNAGGIDRGISGFGNIIIAFQDRGIYALTPTENAQVPYRRVQYSDSLGAVTHQSIVQAEDEAGRPALYFLDPIRGPYRLGYDGFKWVGKDVKDVWDTVNLDATVTVAHGIYFERKRQIWWWVATGSSNDPDTMIVLDVTDQRQDEDGDLRGGWSKWNGALANCRCSAMMSTTLGASMSIGLSPYAGYDTGAVLLKSDTSDTDDNGTDFQGYVESGALNIEPIPQHKAVARSWLLATANDAVTITQTFIRNFGDETNRTSSVLLTAAGSETRVLKKFEDSALEDALLFQVRLGDASANDAAWQLDRWYAEVHGRETL